MSETRDIVEVLESLARKIRTTAAVGEADAAACDAAARRLRSLVEGRGVEDDPWEDVRELGPFEVFENEDGDLWAVRRLTEIERDAEVLAGPADTIIDLLDCLKGAVQRERNVRVRAFGHDGGTET